MREKKRGRGEETLIKEGECEREREYRWRNKQRKTERDVITDSRC